MQHTFAKYKSSYFGGSWVRNLSLTKWIAAPFHMDSCAALPQGVTGVLLNSLDCKKCVCT